MHQPFLVDVCGTLVHDDTTLGLLAEHFRAGPKARLYRLLTMRVIKLAFALAERMTKRQLYKTVMLRLLEGEMKSELEASASVYAREVLNHRRVSEVEVLLTGPIADGRVDLTSASLSPVVSAIALALGGLPFLASEKREPS